MLEGLDSASDELVLRLQRGFRGALDRCIRAQWEQRLNERLDKGDIPLYATDRFHGGTLTPPEFLEKHWGQFIDHGVLYQNVLRDYDPTLIDNVHSYWRRHGRGSDHTKPGNRLPLSSEVRADAIAAEIAAGPYTLKEIIRSIRTLDKRRSRTGSDLPDIP